MPYGTLAGMTRRAIFYIDGFNLYHAIDDLNTPHLKWLSLRDLAQQIIPKQTEHLEGVVYFSAYAHHLSKRDPSKVQRHRAYVAALEATGVECVMGRFKPKNMRCYNCHNRWKQPEEKETDVAIAVRIISDAFNDAFDICYLVTGDTDLMPAVRLLRDSFPSKELVTLAPPHRRHSADILKLASRKVKLKPQRLGHALLPTTVPNPASGTSIIRPGEYDPPR